MNKDLEMALNEIKENGLLLSFDYSSTPFWFTRSVPHIQGQNIPDSYMVTLIDKEIMEEIYQERKVWLDKISSGMSEWEIDLEHKNSIENIGKKITKKSGLKVFMHRLNNVENEHYQTFEIKI